MSAVNKVIAGPAQEVRPLLDEEVEDGEVSNEQDAGQGEWQDSEALEAPVQGIK